MGKKGKKKRRPEVKPAPAPSRRPRPWEANAVRTILTVMLLALPLLPWHPFYFLPAVLYWPLYVATATACWVPLLAGGDRPPRSASVSVEAAGLALVFGSFFLLKVVGIHPSGTDENIYYYMAARMARGAIPYRDFFFSHPPVHLIVPTAVFGLTGFSIGVAKLIPVAAQAVAGLFVYLTIRPSSRVMAILALLLHLTAYQVLMGSTDMNGENLMTAFMAASMFAAVRGRYMGSGILAGLGLGCGLYGLAVVVALTVATAFTSKRALGRFGTGFAAGFVGVMLPFAILGGSGFVEGVFSYHFAKPVKGGGRVPMFDSANPFTMAGAYANNFKAFLSSKGFAKSLYYHAPGYVAAILAVLTVLWRSFSKWWKNAGVPADGRVERPWYSSLSPKDLLSGTPEGLMKLGALAVALFLCEYAALNEFYDFYAVPMMAFVAVPAAFFVFRVFRAIREVASFGKLALPVALIAAFSLHGAWAVHLNGSLWPQEAASAGKVVEYDWREPDAPGVLSDLSRALFFEDSRVKGEVTPYYRHYVWNKRLTFSRVGEIAEYVGGHTEPDETITGASTIAPLVALVAGRRMPGDEADTNSKRFKAGVLTERDFFEGACADRVRYIVSAPRSKFTRRFMETNPFVRNNFRREVEFVDSKLNHFRGYPITLYRRVDGPAPADGKVCEYR